MVGCPNFGRSVLGCIKADFASCYSRLILRHLSDLQDRHVFEPFQTQALQRFPPAYALPVFIRFRCGFYGSRFFPHIVFELDSNFCRRSAICTAGERAVRVQLPHGERVFPLDAVLGDTSTQEDVRPPFVFFASPPEATLLRARWLWSVVDT